MKSESSAIVDWQYEGPIDFFVGTGATFAEKSLAWGGGIVLLVLIYLLSWQHQQFRWTWWQWMLAAIVMIDIGGGVVANALNCQKRYAHAPIQPEETGFYRVLKKYPIVFVALHIHSFIIAAAFEGGIAFALTWYLGILAAHFIVNASPLYLRRPISFGSVAIAMLINLYAMTPPSGFEWFAPFLAIKLIYGHGVQEEPYRPIS